jgi:phage repressor protein C with HTH and peptisase S24 domain
MPFSEQTKQIVKRKSAFRCCRCQEIGIDVHHVIPQALGGSDEIDNAAPLCQNCHDRFGDNPQKRKELLQMRDWWYSSVEQRFGKSTEYPLELSTLEDDIRDFIDQHRALFENLSQKIVKDKPTTSARVTPTDMFVKKITEYDYVTVDDIEDPSAFALRASGKSMEPRICEGDIVIVSPMAEVRSGDICVVRVDDDDTLMKIEFDGNFIHLIPTHPDYKPVTAKRKDVKILWRIVRIVSYV